jgi:hypothetical protein
MKNLKRIPTTKLSKNRTIVLKLIGQDNISEYRDGHLK